jgi:predicted ATP-dependent endonuclease of OLD family
MGGVGGRAMRIKRVEIENFRALRKVGLNMSSTTGLLGENNSGKSAFLRAIELFYASSPRLNDKDFSDGNTEHPIHITLHFTDLTPYEIGEFSGNMLDGELIITRSFWHNNASESGKYFVSARVNPDFAECRNEEGKTEKRKLYAALIEKYGDELPKEKSADQISGFLEDWESNHPEALQMLKVSAFKGFTNVGAGKLKNKTNYVLIRAGQNIADDVNDSKNSPVKQLLNTIARQTMENSKEFQEFMVEANAKIAALTDPANVPVLGEISSSLTRILSDYYKDSEIIASWQPVSQISPTFPATDIDIKDNDFITKLDGVGHGLQRAVILTVLQFMAEHTAIVEAEGDEFAEAQSDLIIGIEEPEIYQHPTKQRLFGKLLHKLSKDFNRKTGIRAQIIFVTHSQLMTSLAECEGIRMVRTIKVDGKKNVAVNEISLANCAARSAKIAGISPAKAWSAAQYAAKLHTFSSDLAEGFFAKCIVLVEGVGDVAIIESWFKIRNRDPHAEGVVIVGVSGKNNLDKPILIFSELGIPCYWIFDNDQKDKETQKAADRIKTNKILQRLAGIAEEQCADWPVGQFDRCASWDTKLEKYITTKVGQVNFDTIAAQCAADYDIEVGQCLKFPATSAAILKHFSDENIQFTELDNVLSKIDALLAA